MFLSHLTQSRRGDGKNPATGISRVTGIYLVVVHGRFQAGKCVISQARLRAGFVALISKSNSPK